MTEEEILLTIKRLSKSASRWLSLHTNQKTELAVTAADAEQEAFLFYIERKEYLLGIEPWKAYKAIRRKIFSYLNKEYFRRTECIADTILDSVFYDCMLPSFEKLSRQEEVVIASGKDYKKAVAYGVSREAYYRIRKQLHEKILP